jgi:uncharacterized RDD family membrane protein YckC
VTDNTPYYPGKRFGLPQEGPGSAAPMGRRLLALILDWVLCELIVAAILRHPLTAGASDPQYFATQYWTLLVFGLEVWLLTGVSGLTIGKRLMRIRTIRTGGGRPGFGWALVRTILLFCVVPPCLADRDLRGLHDRAADTIVVRM